MSNNRLLGSGVNYEALANLPPPKDEVQEFAPAWRFHKDCLEGKVVKTDKALEELDEAGWKDHPGKVRCLPGHEAIWEAELEKEIEEGIKTTAKELIGFLQKMKRFHFLEFILHFGSL